MKCFILFEECNKFSNNAKYFQIYLIIYQNTAHKFLVITFQLQM